MSRMVLLVFGGLTLAAQTQIDLRTQAKRVDFTAADSTRPLKTGTTLPATCAPGDMFFKTDAPAGGNVYGCLSTNVWSAQGNLSVKSGGFTVGARGSANFITGAGLMSTISDDGSEINIQSALDTAVVQTQPGEQSGRTLFCASSSGSASQYTCSLNPTLAAYTTGMALHWRPDVAGAGGPTTLNIDTLGPKPLKAADGGVGDPAATDIAVGKMYNIWYDGNVFRMVNGAGGSGGGASPALSASGPITFNSSTGAIGCATCLTTGTAADTDLSGTFPHLSVVKVNGTSVPANPSADQVLGTTGSATGAWISVANCSAGMLQYSTASHAFSCGTPLSNPMTAAGDLLFGGASGAFTRLAGDTSDARRFLRAQSSGGTAAAPAWDTLAAADIPAVLSATTSVNGTPIPASATLMTTGTAVQASQMPALSGDCTSAAGSTAVTCTKAAGASRTYPFVWQGAMQAGIAGFAVNLPASNGPSPTNSGGTMPIAVLEWPPAQSVYYAWWTWAMPAGYTANAPIGYSIESRCNAANCDATHASIMTLGLGCASGAVLDAPTMANASPVNITNGAAAIQTITAGTLTPNSGGLPACAAGNRVWVKMMVDTNANSVTGPFDLVSATFSVQGGM